jgi:hypothetical protein
VFAFGVHMQKFFLTHAPASRIRFRMRNKPNCGKSDGSERYMQDYELISVKAMRPDLAKRQNMLRINTPLMILIAVLSILSTGLSGVRGMGPAQAGTIEMVICAGGGEAVITLDGAGNPVDPAMTCPECPQCLLPAVALPSATGGASAPVAAARQVHVHLMTAPILARACPVHRARAPPEKA